MQGWITDECDRSTVKNSLAVLVRVMDSTALPVVPLGQAEPLPRSSTARRSRGEAADGLKPQASALHQDLPDFVGKLAHNGARSGSGGWVREMSCGGLPRDGRHDGVVVVLTDER